MEPQPGLHHPNLPFFFLFFFFFSFLFFQIFFLGISGRSGREGGGGAPASAAISTQSPPSSKEPWGLGASESDHPHREPDGLGRGFLSLAKLAPCYSDLDPKSKVYIDTEKINV